MFFKQETRLVFKVGGVGENNKMTSNNMRNRNTSH